jgi:MarR family
MDKQDALRPLDIPVALALAFSKEPSTATFSQVGLVLGMSSSTVFQSVKRLEAAGLVRPGTKEPNQLALREFLTHGVRYAFPPALGREVRGVPTAHSGPALQDMFDAEQPMVWPDVDGQVRGTALAPLYPKAVELPERAPEIYWALTLVDAIRAGQARERKAAIEALEQTFSAQRKSESSAG